MIIWSAAKTHGSCSATWILILLFKLWCNLKDFDQIYKVKRAVSEMLGQQFIAATGQQLKVIFSLEKGCESILSGECGSLLVCVILDDFGQCAIADSAL